MNAIPPPANSAPRQSAARLAAVQAAYQTLLTGADVEGVESHILAVGGVVIDIDARAEKTVTVPFNTELFLFLTRGVADATERLDHAINGALSGGWHGDRLRPLVRAVLRCGLYELLERPETPPRVCVCEYVDIARSFFDGSAEPGMVNAVLDALARKQRAAPPRDCSEVPSDDGGSI